VPTPVILRTREDIAPIEAAVRDAANRSCERLAVQAPQLAKDEGLELLRRLKFTRFGHDPVTGAPINLIEQVNQTFTVLVALRAAAWLFGVHPDCGGIHARFATAAGFDLESCEPKLFAAEVFAATHPRSNGKLKKDIERLASKADVFGRRYVFFNSPGFQSGRRPELEMPGKDVAVIAVDL